MLFDIHEEKVLFILFDIQVRVGVRVRVRVKG